MPRFAVQSVGEWIVAGTGYTGEDGVEIHVPGGERAGVVGCDRRPPGITPAGLGARDTLRLEAGLPLHGHELGAGITPLQAGLGWVVRWDKGDFRGRGPLEAERDTGGRAALARDRRSRAGARPAMVRACWSTARRSASCHQRQLLTDARPRDRASRSCAPISSPAPRSSSMYAARCSRSRS